MPGLVRASSRNVTEMNGSISPASHAACTLFFFNSPLGCAYSATTVDRKSCLRNYPIVSLTKENTLVLSAVSSLHGVCWSPYEPANDGGSDRWTESTGLIATNLAVAANLHGVRAVLLRVILTSPDVGHKMEGSPRRSAQRDSCLRL